MRNALHVVAGLALIAKRISTSKRAGVAEERRADERITLSTHLTLAAAHDGDNHIARRGVDRNRTAACWAAPNAARTALADDLEATTAVGNRAARDAAARH